MKTIQEFYQWERATRDTLDVKKIYIDIADEDLVAGILLSQIIYWYLPNRDNKSKLSIFKENRWWIAKGREDWWEEVRISPKQFDRAVKVLEDRNLVFTKVFKFDGNPTKHISLNEEVLLDEVNRMLSKKSDFDQKENSFLPKGKKPISLNNKSDIDVSGDSLTEITSEITTKKNNQSINQSYFDGQAEDYPEELKIILDNSELEAFDEGIQKILTFAIEDLYFNMGSTGISEFPLAIIRKRMFDICYPALELAWGNYCRMKESTGITNHRSYLSKCIWSALIESPMNRESTRDVLPDIQGYIPIKRQIDLYIKENIDHGRVITIKSFPNLPFGRMLQTQEGQKLVVYWDRENRRVIMDNLDAIKKLYQNKSD